MAIFIYSQSFCQKSAERKSPRNTFCILLDIKLGLDIKPGARTLALRLISQPTTYYTTATHADAEFPESRDITLARVLSSGSETKLSWLLENVLYIAPYFKYFIW